jgi:hypothetical protein
VLAATGGWVPLLQGTRGWLSFDVGGHHDFDTPARYRVSFSND